MTGWPTGGGGGLTVRLIDVVADRFWASRMATGRVLAPAGVPGTTVARKLKLLPPSSLKACVDDPPIEDRSALTSIAVLVGLVPGLTVTVSSDVPPTTTGFGFADPAPEGFVLVTCGVPVIEMSSIPIHSSLPAASVVMMRTWTTGWLSALAGRLTETGVT